MDPSWKVIPYSGDVLRRLLAQRPEPRALARIEKKLHAAFFEEYFDNLSAKTILVERQYVDRDFLEDFAAYYVRCFESIGRLCSRLHFFDKAFNQDEFAALLDGGPQAGDLEENLRASYLGFVVVKPLPQTVVGRTCLVTYPSDNGRRHFPITRTYAANLFGVRLEVKTLAFQEQDRVAAACATSALWSAFHGTGVLFQHRIPSPVEITQSATAVILGESRALPSGGLTKEQMATAIRQVGLEPTLINAADEAVFLSTTYAYVRGRVPALLLGSLENLEDPNKPKVLGHHAIVVAGFSLGHETAKPQGRHGLRLTASRIDKLYCHDDQVGPFARMACTRAGSKLALSTSWPDDANKRGNVFFVPQALLLPLYHKIRIPFSAALEEVIAFDAFLAGLRKAFPSLPIPTLEWDLALAYVNDYKTAILQEHPPIGSRRATLESPMPKFIWCARGVEAGSATLDLLFDATGVELGDYCFRVVERSPFLGNIVRALMNTPSALPVLQAERCWPILERFSTSP